MFKRVADFMFPKLERSHEFPLSVWAKYISKYGLGSGRTFGVQGHSYNSEGVPNDYESYAVRWYKSNSVVWATASVRRRVFSQITFKFRPRDSINGEHSLKDSHLLDVLDHPAPGRGTSWMLNRALMDVDIAGNSYWIKEYMADGEWRLRRLRPDWVDILLTAPPEEALQSDVAGYAYYPGGGTSEPYIFLPEEVCHWAPDPDPEAQYRGMSPMTPLWRDLCIEESANEHRISFFKRGAQPNFAIIMKERHTPEQLDAIQARFEATHAGAQNAYSPMFIGAGADVLPVETNVSDLDMKNISGRAETHIANVFGVHPAVVGLSEGMQGSSLNAGNYKVTARGFINQTMHPLWQSFCEAMEVLVKPPKPTRAKPDRMRLWYSSADVSILNDDREERAEIKGKDAETVNKLIREGWTPESAKDYVQTGDFSKLKHSGYVSVQLYDPNAVDTGMGTSNLAPGVKPKADNAPSGKPAQPNVDPKAAQAAKPSKEN